MTAKEVEASELRGKMRVLQEKCRSASEEFSAEILAVIALAQQNLDLELQVKNREQSLVAAERKLQVASIVALSA